MAQDITIAVLVACSFMAGQIFAMILAVVFYHFGSSSDSRAKDGVIAGQLPGAPKVPSQTPPPTPEPTALPKHQWPLQSECNAFYGDPNSSGWEAANLVHVECPWQLQMEGKPVSSIVIHQKCAESLKQVLAAIWEECGKDEGKIKALHYDRYDGSFNLRPMRGGSNLSMHAYGCALDFDAEGNPFHSEKHLFTADSIIVKKFEAAGWIWGGRWLQPDAMHFQAARVHP